ncbi:hypothetical protein FVEG_12430 [Fusarium verticillioides 7600]|uniref:Uncharacterized protein n=1 Tax=Gibberella moniliformis (strain M3125 / FGSC 7600) TaxID=334819 RepID=W7MSR1_GIBM7|nr:hypothetical protein FVEG_12430 [Fusarium verticillioides 7600]EWG54146.1 hypothetical protein FVEG_12430 [Fusarium verticillioides 7600]
MISHKLLSGTVVLLLATLANAGPCRPSSIISSSTYIASVSETATSSFESESVTSTASVVTTQTTTTATESKPESETGYTATVDTTPTVSSVETTTTALVDTTTTTAATTTETTEGTTTTAAATTTTEGPEVVQSIYMFGHSTTNPGLADTGGTGFVSLSDTSIPDVEFIDFRSAGAAGDLFFTLGERSGKVKIGNGANVGKLVGYFPSSDYSLVIAAETALAEDNGVSPLDCDIVSPNGYPQLQCQYGDQGLADFWTCDGHWTLVIPGFDFTSKCARAATSYKLDYIEVDYVQ